MNRKKAKDKHTRITDETTIMGRNIRNLRTRAGYSQQDIAKALGVSFQQIQKYEAGKTASPLKHSTGLRSFMASLTPISLKGWTIK
ncbi:MAG: helix-turn-helix transcriptional regulator [Alphaproteobacteria bacterium]